MIKTSEQTNEIFKALAQFQKEVEQPKKDANNPFFKSKYVPLENVVDVIHKASAPLGLYEATYPAQEDGLVGVGVIITHESGQFIEYPPVLLRPSKNDPQGYGAAMTYARRYALSAAFGIASETDDDGNSISGEVAPKKVSKKQINDIIGLFAPERIEGMLKAYKIDKLQDLPEPQATKIIEIERKNQSKKEVENVKDIS